MDKEFLTTIVKESRSDYVIHYQNHGYYPEFEFEAEIEFGVNVHWGYYLGLKENRLIIIPDNTKWTEEHCLELSKPNSDPTKLINKIVNKYEQLKAEVLKREVRNKK